MAGYGVDPEALQAAIDKLKGARERVEAIVRRAAKVSPGELTANDTYTNNARQTFQDRATGDKGSLRIAADELNDKLGAKIAAYEATIREYQRNDDTAASDASRVQ
ncbi:hypothetical protein [Saccharopolyspora sp. ASAGF58]|uniref:hypothetical protein n=1 Tax=Saccharopolyspora sp. ASAGF58 TaxID=2719023 RepID=UPI00143FE7B5|nr:hypothetical protein [Saccharopolyspora sp. ASAGF58]QIZ34125.1 hypothetical protein FDZ84_04460 [Saccharopolyspora sp. ASAGF58]